MRVMMMKMMMMMMMKALQLDQTRVKAQKAEDTIQVLLGQLNLILKMMSKVRRNHRILMHLRPNNIQLLLNWLANSLDTRDVDYFTSSMPNMNDLDTSEHSSMTFLKQDEEACLRLKDTDNAHIPKDQRTTGQMYATTYKFLCEEQASKEDVMNIGFLHSNGSAVGLTNRKEEACKCSFGRDKERKTALSISKLKAARYLDFGLEELSYPDGEYSQCVPCQDFEEKYELTNTWERFISSRADYKEYKISKKDFKNLHPNDFEDLYLLNIQDKLNHLSKSDKIHLHTAVNMWIRNLVIRNRVGDLQLGIKRYQTKLNLEHHNWDATDYSFKEDYTIVPKPRTVIYRDRNDQRKLMRLNEIPQSLDMEKLDHMVKDFHLFEYNKGMETRKWYRDDKEESKDSSQ
ncbi:hypothetical protein Tco_0210016 [Tanacetum coccineum]